MTKSSEQDRLLEIYKLHAELADGVSRRREGANRLYVSLHVGLVVFLAALLRFGSGDTPEGLVLGIIALFGALLSVSWIVVIQSYKQLNHKKFRVLHDLEKLLPFQFFVSEWDPKSEGKKSNRYWKLTYVEKSLPFLFIILYLLVGVYSFFS